MNKEHNEALLNAIYQNCRMGMHSIDTILNDVKHPLFLEEITRENETYTVTSKECEMLARANDIELKDISLMDKTMVYVTEKCKTLLNKTCRKFALMMFLGTNMGIPDLIIALCDYDEADKEIINLAKTLLKTEEEYAFDIKKYLCCDD